MIQLIIYLIGVIISYYLLRNKTKQDGNEWSWELVIIVAMISVFSWGIVILFVLFKIIEVAGTIKSKPPKWL